MSNSWPDTFCLHPLFTQCSCNMIVSFRRNEIGGKFNVSAFLKQISFLAFIMTCCQQVAQQPGLQVRIKNKRYLASSATFNEFSSIVGGGNYEFYQCCMNIHNNVQKAWNVNERHDNDEFAAAKCKTRFMCWLQMPNHSLRHCFLGIVQFFHASRKISGNTLSVLNGEFKWICRTVWETTATCGSPSLWSLACAFVFDKQKHQSTTQLRQKHQSKIQLLDLLRPGRSDEHIRLFCSLTWNIQCTGHNKDWLSQQEYAHVVFPSKCWHKFLCILVLGLTKSSVSRCPAFMTI